MHVPAAKPPPRGLPVSSCLWGAENALKCIFHYIYRTFNAHLNEKSHGYRMLRRGKVNFLESPACRHPARIDPSGPALLETGTKETGQPIWPKPKYGLIGGGEKNRCNQTSKWGADSICSKQSSKDSS